MIWLSIDTHGNACMSGWNCAMPELNEEENLCVACGLEGKIYNFCTDIWTFPPPMFYDGALHSWIKYFLARIHLITAPTLYTILFQTHLMFIYFTWLLKGAQTFSLLVPRRNTLSSVSVHFLPFQIFRSEAKILDVVPILLPSFFHINQRFIDIEKNVCRVPKAHIDFCLLCIKLFCRNPPRI